MVSALKKISPYARLPSAHIFLDVPRSKALCLTSLVNLAKEAERKELDETVVATYFFLDVISEDARNFDGSYRLANARKAHNLTLLAVEKL